MDIHACGSTPTRRGKAEWFTGTVLQDPIIEAPEPARVRATTVRFEPGARTNWHTHPLGQTLYIVSGSGRQEAIAVASFALSGWAQSAAGMKSRLKTASPIAERSQVA